MDWKSKSCAPVPVNEKKALSERSAYLDISSAGGQRLRFGDETLFINAAIMNVRYSPRNAPWVVDLDLPRADGADDVLLLP